MRAISFAVGVALVASSSALARAQDATKQNTMVLPVLVLDTGIGASEPNLATTTFHYGGYSVLGSQIGFQNPLSLVYTSSLHIFPFSLREIGFIVTTETISRSSNGTYSTPTGTIGDDASSKTTYYSVQAGPEAQMRFDAFTFRVGGVLGWRDVSFDHYDALDWRAGVRGQVEYTFLGGRAGSSGLSIGLFANVDALPGFGWSSGATVTFAYF